MDLKENGHIYSRISNPTLACVESKIADLEGGTGALLLASGQAATMTAVLNITSAGQNIISLSYVYGGTANLFSTVFARMGIEVRYVTNSMSDGEIYGKIDENTRLIFGETISNPALDVLDIERYAKIAHARNIPLIVDNTFATPVFCRPFEHGADIVTHSTSKYMDGHATVLGGVIVDGGRFNWKESGKFPELTEPDKSYHGIVYTEKYSNSLAYITKARVQLLRDFGNIMPPSSAFILDLGLSTLSIRMERHCQNALAVASYLEKSPYADWVKYPLLASNPQYALAKKYFPEGCCGVVSFGVKGGRKAAEKFMNSLKLISICVHVADARSMVVHPASTTHRQLSEEQLADCGVLPEMVRLSVGIEDIKDITADIEAALKA